MQKTLVSIIIPAFNEERTVGDVVNSASEIMDDLKVPYEIIVVSDGSIDDTASIALSTCKATVLSNESNHGKGYCLRKALSWAHGDIVVTLDSDGQHTPKEIPDLLNPIFEGADVVAGSRFMSERADVTSSINQVGNSLFNISIMALTGRKVTDSQTGFRAMKRAVLDELVLESDGYEIETEITVKALRGGYDFREVPISVQKREYNISRIKMLADGKKILSTVIRSSLLPMEKYRF